MKRPAVDWHFPRTGLASHYIRMFTDVGSHSSVLFAPRGKGKTAFLNRDLEPAAREAGMFPVFVNYWDDNARPAASLIYAMVRAAEEAGFAQEVKASLGRIRGDFEFEMDLGVAKIKGKPKLAASPVATAAEKAEKQRGTTTTGDGDSVLFAMRRVLDALHDKVGKDILFLFDEVQTLASKAEHETFVRSLRTLLDERRSHVKSIFTGSSQGRLTEMFKRIKAPLYNYASITDFPDLDDRFLEHWMNNIAMVMGGAKSHRDAPAVAQSMGLKLDKMRQAFDATGRNPRMFWGAVEAMIASNSLDVVKFARAEAESTEENAGMGQRLAELSAIDQLVLREIVADSIARRDGTPQASAGATSSGTSGGGVAPLQLFSAETRARMGTTLGLTPSVVQVQGAVRRLGSTEIQLIVSKDRGVYELDDPFFLDYFAEKLGVFESHEFDDDPPAPVRDRRG